jgi:hypothetical protein
VSRSAYPPAVAALVVLAAVTGCSPSPSTEPASDADQLLPSALVVRSDTPYITGAVVGRDEGGRGALRVRVRAPDSASVSASRVPEAVVTIHPDSLLVFRDGRAASADELTVGRTIAVWVRGPELRSLPPQVTGSAILVERR